MSITNSILKILNMKDKNIKFDEDFCEEQEINGKRCIIFKGYLENSFSCCPKCGCIHCMKKYGVKSSLIKIPKVSEICSYLLLKKQVYKCNHCNKKTIAKTTEIEYRCRISNNTKHSITIYSKQVIPHKLIAEIHNVSNMTVQRQNNKIYDDEKLYKNNLPENICIDEFTYKKKIMAFNFCDAENGKTVDLV